MDTQPHTHSHTHTATHTQTFFNMSLVGNDRIAVIEAINQGIDSRLEAFTADNLRWSGENGRLYIDLLNCYSFQLLVRRLIESGNDDFADTMIYVKYGIEVI